MEKIILIHLLYFHNKILHLFISNNYILDIDKYQLNLISKIIYLYHNSNHVDLFVHSTILCTLSLAIVLHLTIINLLYN